MHTRSYLTQVKYNKERYITQITEFILREALTEAGTASVMLVALEPNTRVHAMGRMPASPSNLLVTVSISVELVMGSVAL